VRRALVVAATLIVGACTSGRGGRPSIKLDGSPHVASDAGIVTAADRHHVTLDGKRRYAVNPNLVVFTPGTLELAPLAGALGRYALVGTDAGRLDWLEPLSAVAALPGGPPTVFFYGTIATSVATTLTFADGTVLTLAPGVKFPASVSLPVAVRADIDPGSHFVRALSPGS